VPTHYISVGLYLGPNNVTVKVNWGSNFCGLRSKYGIWLLACKIWTFRILSNSLQSCFFSINYRIASRF